MVKVNLLYQKCKLFKLIGYKESLLVKLLSNIQKAKYIMVRVEIIKDTVRAIYFLLMVANIKVNLQMDR